MSVALALSPYLSFDYLAPLGVDVLLLMTLALSLTLINGCAGMFSLGHQGFYGVGAYVAAATANVFVTAIGPRLGLTSLAEHGELLKGGAAHQLDPAVGVPVLVASILAGGLAAAIFGLIVGIPCLRLKGDYLAIATLGFAEIFRVAVSQIEALGASRGLSIDYAVVFTRARSEKMSFYVLFLALSGALVLWTLLVIRNMMKSSHGRAIYAIREDEVAAELLGVDLTRYKVIVFAIGAGFAGLAGGVLAHAKLYITPIDFGLMFGVVLLLYTVLGGRGSLAGSMLAVVVLFGLERALATRFFGSLPPRASDVVGEWWQVIYALLLIVLVIARPQGILGKRTV
jgi:branched-chain amino acid transport system permease protein